MSEEVTLVWLTDTLEWWDADADVYLTVYPQYRAWVPDPPMTLTWRRG